jgi:hypothetical protein
MYESLRPLDKMIDLPRLPAPESVLPQLNPIAIPIAPIEAASMTERFPIAWRRQGELWDLVALTGLLPIQETWKPGPGDSGSRVIPLLLRAYPLAVVEREEDETLRVMVDASALLTPWHADVRAYEPEAGQQALQRRLQALWTFAGSRRALQPAFRDIAADGGFLPWDLGFTRDGESIALEGFYYVDWEYLGSTRHQALVEHHGWLCASLLALHRMSQHRLSALLRDLGERVRAA